MSGSAVPGQAVPGLAAPGMAAAPTVAMYATTNFTIQLPGGGSEAVIKGSRRDSAHPAVTGAAGLFTTVPPVVGVDVGALLAGRLQAYPAGTEL